MCFKNVEKTRSGEREKHGFRIGKMQKNLGFGFYEVLGYNDGKMVFMDLWLRKMCFQNLEKRALKSVGKKGIKNAKTTRFLESGRKRALKRAKKHASQNLDETRS